MKYTVEDKIKQFGELYGTKKEKLAYRAALRAEKNAFSKKDFEELKKVVRNLPKGELAGKTTKGGKIKVSKKVPRRLREEVAFNEEIYYEHLRKKK